MKQKEEENSASIVGSIVPTRIKTIKVEIRTWDMLKSLKKENETFDDVIKDLLKERTVSIGNNNVKAIKYARKVAFFMDTVSTINILEEVGFEFEYNDIKSNKSDFVLDLKIKKVFFRKKILNPSEFFGVDNLHKHYSKDFLLTYLKAIALVLKKEFRTELRLGKGEYENIANWRQFYYDYSLSDESFKQDIEEPLMLSEDEKPKLEWKQKIDNSILQKFKEANK